MNNRLVFVFLLIAAELMLSACSNADLARLIEPRKHKPVIAHHSKPVAKPYPQRQKVVYASPKARQVSVKPKISICSYVVRDLSKPNASRVWCHPGRTR